MWLQLTVKKTCCERKHCAFCAPCCETVTLSYFGCKSSTLRVFHFGSCTGSCSLCVTFFARISTRGNRFVFLPPSPVTWRCWGKKKSVLVTAWPAHPPPLWPHLLSLFPIPTYSSHTGLMAAFRTYQVLFCLWAFAFALPFPGTHSVPYRHKTYRHKIGISKYWVIWITPLADWAPASAFLFV